MAQETTTQKNNAKQQQKPKQNNAKWNDQKPAENTEKQPQTISSNEHVESSEVNEYFEEISLKNTTANSIVDDDQTQPSSSFSDFDVFETDEVTDNIDTVLPSTAVEIYEEADSGESEVLYSTGDLAKMFDVSTQTIRNTADFYVEILSDERGANGQKLYNSEDIAIIKKIFYMTNVQKYKRRDVREQLLLNGISAKKGVNNALNVNLDNLPRSVEHTPVQRENSELIQAKLTEALSSLQQNMTLQITEGFSSLENSIKLSFSKDIKDSSVMIGDKITKTKEELVQTIQNQSQIIKEQHDQIIKLKSTIININKSVLKIEDSVAGLGTSGISKEDLEQLVNGIDEVAKACATTTLSDNVTKLSSQSQNSAKLIKEEIDKQGKTLQTIEQKIVNLEQNTPKENKDKQNNIKNNVADTLNRNYQKFEKALKDNSQSQLETIGGKLSEITTLLQKESSNINEKEVDELNLKLNEALDSIEQLKAENIDLENKNEISEKIIDKQTAKIEELKTQITQNTTKTEVIDNPDTMNKLLIAQKLIEKLSSENNELKNKDMIKGIIIEKQDAQIKQFKEKAQNDVLTTNNGGIYDNNPSKFNTAPSVDESRTNTKDQDELLSLLLDE